MIPFVSIHSYVSEEMIDAELEEINIPLETALSNEVSHQLWFIKVSVLDRRRQHEVKREKKRVENEKSEKRKAGKRALQAIQQEVSNSEDTASNLDQLLECLKPQKRGKGY